MSILARRVGLTIRRHRLIASGDSVAVAVSGGSDSVALAWLLHDLASRGAWRFAGLIHVHHGLRGADADEDAAFCSALAARLRVPVDLAHVDVTTRMRDARQSLEAAARAVRYEAFEAAAVRLGATLVATGHTMDDQAETVMLRLLRGATLRGASGVRVARGRYIRPVIHCRRHDLRADLARRGESFREDASNADVTIARNRLRHQLMPVIEQMTRGGVPALARFADLAAEDEALLGDTARAAARAIVVRSESGGVQLIRSSLAVLPRAIGRRVIRDTLESAGVAADSQHVDAILRAATGARQTLVLDLPAVRVVLDHAHLVFDLRVAASDPAPEFSCILAVPGSVEITGGRGEVRASHREESVRPVADEDRLAALQGDTLTLPLTVRSWQAGDRFRPLGAPGSRKLQDAFVDRKIPRSRRPDVPIVTDAEGRIVWVPGVGIAHDSRVTRPEAGMVILEFKEPKKGHQ